MVMDPPAGRPNNSSSSTLPWSSLPPPGVDRPESFVEDRACHGILGVTLRQALEELLVEQASSPSKRTLTAPGEEAPSRGRASHNSRNEDDDEDEDDDDTISSKDESMDPKDPGELFMATQLNSDMVPPILNSLGRAMLDTHEDRRRNVHVSEWVSGLVRGRVRYYHRRFDKWRFVADSGAQIRLIRPRQRRGVCRSSSTTTTTTPSGQQPTLRRGADGRRRSLWDAAAAAAASAATERSGGGASGVVTLAGPLEILAHNDNE